MNSQAQQGMVLIMALLYLSVVTLLVLVAFESGLVQIKISAHLSDNEQSLQNAETALLGGETAIQGNEIEGQGKIDATASYRYKRRPESACGVAYYEINATGVYAASKTELESILSVPVGSPDECDAIPVREEIAWRQVL